MLGQYAVYGEIAAGGMATIHFGRLLAPNGYTRTVAIKRLHPHFAKDAEFRTMFLDEARVAVHVAHRNVVGTLDVVGMENELFLVMEYVPGESLSRLIRLTKEKKRLIPPRIAIAVIAGTLRGLHAAHEAKDAAGHPLHIVHRDISPQNVLVGVDGVARVLDFGVAKAVGRHQQTREGQLKGKLAYMAPEQLNGEVTPRTDVYAAGVTLWEALTAKRLFNADNEAAILGKILGGMVEPPSLHVPSTDLETSDMLKKLDAIVARAVDRDPAKRFPTALAMAQALEKLPIASPAEVAHYTEKTAHEALKRRASILAMIEQSGGAFGASSVPPSEFKSEPRTQMAVASRSLPPSYDYERSQYSDTASPVRKKPSMLLVGAGIFALAILFAAAGAIIATTTDRSIPPAQAVQPGAIPPARPAPTPSAIPALSVTPTPVENHAPTPATSVTATPPTSPTLPSASVSAAASGSTLGPAANAPNAAATPSAPNAPAPSTR